jgi:hypothetical protein
LTRLLFFPLGVKFHLASDLIGCDKVLVIVLFLFWIADNSSFIFWVWMARVFLLPSQSPICCCVCFM